MGIFLKYLLARYEFEPVRKKTFKLGEDIFFHQEPYFLNKSRFSNLYWVEAPKNSLFLLKNFLKRLPLIKIPEIIKKEHNLLPVAGINTCNFFLSDYSREPLISSYNLFVSEGKVWQFPSVSRTVLIERGGKLLIKFLKARGKVKIRRKTLNWVGSFELKKKQPFLKRTSVAVTHGVFDIKLKYLFDIDRLRRPKKPLPSSVFVKNKNNKILLGFKLGNKLIPEVAKKSVNQLSLLDYLFIIEVDSSIGKQISIGDKIEEVEVDGYKIGKNDNITSLAFSLPQEFKKIKKSLSKELISKDGGKINVLDSDFRRSWSAVVFTSKKIIFFLADAYPYGKGKEGLNIYELHNLLKNKFNFTQCGICDGGQTSKLWVRDSRNKNLRNKIYGNLHYVNFSLKKPKLDGINGRPLPSALFILKSE